MAEERSALVVGDGYAQSRPVRTINRRSPVRRPRLSIPLAVCIVVLGTVVVACGGTSGSPRPSPSLITLDFTPRPSVSLPSVAPTRTAAPSTLASWPVGWDVTFCTDFADVTVAHELVIDIERAIADDNRTDAQGLANELAQTAPIAASEITRMKDWVPATDLKTGLSALLDLDTQAAAAYQSYFNDGVKAALKQARQLRNQVGKQVPSANDQLQQLTDLGLSCPGRDLKLEDVLTL